MRARETIGPAAGLRLRDERDRGAVLCYAVLRCCCGSAEVMETGWLLDETKGRDVGRWSLPQKRV
jgi:hypothetical protein